MTTALVLLAAALVVLPGPPAATRPGPIGSLPLALDLVAVALYSGQPVATSLEIAAPAAPPAYAAQLTNVAALLRLGADPPEAWAAVADAPGSEDLADLARMAGRSSQSGARLADAFGRAAVRLRRAQTAADEARAQRAGVLCAAPLAACFLPSFVCLGIVPTLLGLIRPALSATS